MLKISVRILFFISTISLWSQSAITGYVDYDAYNGQDVEIHLSKIALNDYTNNTFSESSKNNGLIATVKLDKNGFFQFEKTLFSDKDAIYRLYVKRFQPVLNDILTYDRLFLFSKHDSIHFKRSQTPLTDYVNTNSADKEWQKLLTFEKNLLKTTMQSADSLSGAYLGNLKSYAKDSLEILMVKLIGIKQLDNKELLEKDITKNEAYYMALLSELKNSDIDRAEYLFLENKLAFFSAREMKFLYHTFKISSILLGLANVGLLFYIIRSRRKRKRINFSDLSKQERNIRRLILLGMTNKEIAEELFISTSTVKTHITNLYSKLQVSNRQELLKKT